MIETTDLFKEIADLISKENEKPLRFPGKYFAKNPDNPEAVAAADRKNMFMEFWAQTEDGQKALKEVSYKVFCEKLGISSESKEVQDYKEIIKKVLDKLRIENNDNR